MPLSSTSVHGVVRVCSGAIAALVGLRWINRGGRWNGLVALLATVAYMGSQKMHVANGRKVQLGAPGDRTKDHVQTTMAQMAAEQVDREVRRERMEHRLAEDLDDEQADYDEPHRVLSCQAVAVPMGQRMAQHPSQQRSLRHRNARHSSMTPLIESPGVLQEEEDEQEENEQDGETEDDEQGGQNGHDSDDGQGGGDCGEQNEDSASELQLRETDNAPLQVIDSDSDAPEITVNAEGTVQ